MEEITRSPAAQAGCVETSDQECRRSLLASIGVEVIDPLTVAVISSITSLASPTLSVVTHVSMVSRAYTLHSV